MRICSWIVVLAGASWLVLTASGAEPTAPERKGVEIRSPLPGTSVVRSVVKEGTKVKKGDLLITLENSSLRADAERLGIEVAASTAEATAAEAGLQRAAAESKKVDIAEFALKVAELRRQSHSAELEIELKVMEREIEVAKKSFELVKRHVESIVGNGGGGNSVQAAAAELELLKAKVTMETATNKKQLLEIMRPLKEAELELAVKESQMDLAMMKRRTAEDLEVAKASLAARKQVLRVEQDRLKRIEDLFKQCAILAPSDGTVRYYDGRGRIGEGALVRERQSLLRLTSD